MLKKGTHGIHVEHEKSDQQRRIWKAYLNRLNNSNTSDKLRWLQDMGTFSCLQTLTTVRDVWFVRKQRKYKFPV